MYSLVNSKPIVIRTRILPNLGDIPVLSRGNKTRNPVKPFLHLFETDEFNA
jgi:hypothetical protein